MVNRLARKENITNSKRSAVFCGYVIITMAIYMLPYTKLVFPYIPVALLMLLSLPALMFLRNEWSVYSVALMFFTLVLFFFACFSGLVSAINDAVRNLRFFLPILWGAYAVRFCTVKQRKFILIGFFAVALLVFVKTNIALGEDPWIARLLAQDQSYSSDEINQYRLDNVGGYSFAYMIGALTVACAYLALWFKRWWQKVLMVLCIIGAYTYIIQTMYTTLLLLTTVSIFFLLFFYTKSIGAKIILVLIAVGVFVGLPPLLQYLSGVFEEGSLLTVKFEQMYNAVSGEGVDALGGRPQLAKLALENWIKTPLFGAHYTTPSHSLFLELLQQNGLVGIAIWLFLYVYTWRFMYKQLGSRGMNASLFHIGMIYFTALSVFNDTKYTFEITIAVYFIFPVICSLLGMPAKKEKLEKRKKI